VKRWLVALLVILAVVVLISPGIVGRLAEKSLDENIEWVTSENPAVSIVTERFDRGWFTSDGRHRVVFSSGAFHDAAILPGSDTSSADLPALIINTRIDHGLVPVSSLSRESGSLMPALANTISTFQIDPGTGELIAIPGKLYSNIRVSGSSESRFVLESGSFGKDGLDATWQGADLIVVTNPASGNVSVAASIEPSRLSGTSTISIQEVVAPGLGEFALTMDVSLQGLHAKSLGVITAALRNAQEDGNREAALQAIYPQIEDDVQKLVAAGAEIRVDRFDLTLPQGMVSTTLRVEFAEMDEDAKFSWSSVLLKMTASMNLRVSVELYEFAKMMNPEAETLIAMGILKRDGDDYVMAAKYAQGLLNVNGAPMPIPMPAM